MRLIYCIFVLFCLSCGSALQERHPNTYYVNGHTMFLDGTNLRYQNLSWSHAGFCTFYNFLEITNPTYHVSFFPLEYEIDKSICDFFGIRESVLTVHTAILFRERITQKRYVLLYGQDLYEMVEP